jgi:hypothetical protein
MMTQCQKAADAAMIKVCGSTEDCSNLTIDENSGARSLEYKICEYTFNAQTNQFEVNYNACRNDINMIQDTELGRKVAGVVGEELGDGASGSMKAFAGVIDGTIYWDSVNFDPDTGKLMTIDEYISGLKKIIKLSRATGAKLIFATTTPLPASGSAQDNTGTGSTFVFEQERVKIYNDAAIKLMEEENIPINDLYSVCKQDARYYKCEDNLHHTEEGNRVLAQHVANAILKELGME